jgi:hypothetical protein
LTALEKPLSFAGLLTVCELLCVDQHEVLEQLAGLCTTIPMLRQPSWEVTGDAHIPSPTRFAR